MRREKNSSFPLILMTVLIIGGLAGVLFLNWEGIVGYLAKDAILQEREVAGQKIKALEEQLAAQQSQNETAAVEPVATVPGAEETLAGSEGHCQELADKIAKFFLYLDGRDYVAAYKVPGGAKAYFKGSLNKLFAAPPQVVRETDNLSAILKNSVHFFRVLGKNGIFLMRDVLKNEENLLESTLAMFYDWMMAQEQCGKTEVGISLPLPGMYEYAGFFLNTLGGNSYLQRRSPQLRTLVRYYSVLVVDQANSRKQNRHGIDIRLPLRALSDEIEGSAKLMQKEHYLRTLAGLQEKYKGQPAVGVGGPGPKKKGR